MEQSLQYTKRQAFSFQIMISNTHIYTYIWQCRATYSSVHARTQSSIYIAILIVYREAGVFNSNSGFKYTHLYLYVAMQVYTYSSVRAELYSWSNPCSIQRGRRFQFIRPARKVIRGDSADAKFE